MEFIAATVVANQEYGPGHWVIELSPPDRLAPITAGQFVMLRCDPRDAHSLLRPFSILAADPTKNTVSIYYKHLGRLSTQLSQVAVGEELPLLYSLGQGFPFKDHWQSVALVGGGVGIAPLLFAATRLSEEHAGLNIKCFFGGNSATDLVPKLLEQYPLNYELATLDGSLGFPGNTIELFNESAESFDVVFACGPTPMLAALRDALPKGQEAYASLEERMACGVGACLGCATKITNGELVEHRTVCKDGPVFNLNSVVFDKQ